MLFNHSVGEFLKTPRQIPLCNEALLLLIADILTYYYDQASTLVGN